MLIAFIIAFGISNAQIDITYQKPPKEIFFDLNYQDRYSDPGNFLTKKNEWDENTLVIDTGMSKKTTDDIVGLSV